MNDDAEIEERRRAAVTEEMREWLQQDQKRLAARRDEIHQEAIELNATWAAKTQ